jgi:serine/threonine-protein kinase
VTVLEGRYELGHRIGGGGMAEVVEAHDRKLDRRVAVKLLRDGAGDPRARERFAMEARMAAGFSHPNVVSVYDVGEIDGRPYLVMELVSGQSLAEILHARGPLPVDEALTTTDALLSALAAAHDHGLVHRDVKPANVLVASDGRVKLADFGIAKAAQQASASLTATGEVMGTPTYLSPEQVDGLDATTRSDLYAVGLVLYEMLTGGPPFTGDHAVSVALAHKQSPVPPLRDRRPDAGSGIAAVVHRALEKDPARRYGSAPEMQQALRSVAKSGPEPADSTVATALPDPTRSIPITPRTARTRSRQRSGAPLALALAAAVLGAGLGWLLFGGTEANRRAVGAGGETTNASVTPPTATTTTTIPVPTTVEGLIALIEANPGCCGEKEEDLLRRLTELRDRPDPRGKRTEKVAAEVFHWMEEGELDPTIGTLTLRILGYDASSFDQDGRGED